MGRLAAFLLVVALSTPALAEPEVWPVASAENALSDLVGEPFLRKSFTFLAEDSRYDPGAPDCVDCVEWMRRPFFVLEWAFRLPGRAFVDERVVVIVDTEGRILSPPGGIPECKAHPALCASFLDEGDALRVARLDRLTAGLEPWKTDFAFHGGVKRFAWIVSSVTERGDSGSESGDQVQIDAVTGEIVGRGRWFASPALTASGTGSAPP